MPRNRFERVALWTGRRMGVPDLPAGSGPLAARYAGSWHDETDRMDPGYLVVLLRSAGREARWRRDRSWTALLRTYAYVSMPVAAVGAPAAWLTGSDSVARIVLTSQLTSAASMLFVFWCYLADRDRTFRPDDHLTDIGLAAVGGIGAFPAAWVLDERPGPPAELFFGGDAVEISTLAGLLTALGYHEWLGDRDLTAAQQEMFTSLIGEYEDDLDGLVQAVKALT